MEFRNVKKVKEIVEVEFTLKMSMDDLQALVTNLGCTISSQLEENGAPREVAQKALEQYQFFKRIKEEGAK